MNLPFTVEQFLDVFAKYNNAIWPFQALLVLLALTAVFFAVRRYNFSDITISLLLGFVWLWTGIVYHIAFFSVINPAAYIFGALCIIQGLLFIWIGIRKRASFQATFGWRQTVGSFFLLYALLLYPALGLKFGHLFPNAPTFGAPCPTTIFTFGMLLWAVRLPRYAVIIPALWSVLGFAAALKLGIYEDIGLLVAGVAGTIIVFTMNRKGAAISAA
jgi:hypothetical protein